MSKSVHFHVSDDTYEATLYLARLSHKDTIWVLQQWVTHAKDEALERHVGLKQHMETWRADQLREFQHTLDLASGYDQEEEPF